MEAAPSVLWDARHRPGRRGGSRPCPQSGHALEFLKDQYRHCKPILLSGGARSLLTAAGIPTESPTDEKDTGLLIFAHDEVEEGLEAFVSALAQHRHFTRETDPPRV